MPESRGREITGVGTGGFTIVELVVVMCIFAVLLSIGTIQFNNFSTKNGIENQTREILSELTAVRGEAVFQKSRHAVRMTSSTTFAIYSSAVVSVAPVRSKTLSHPVTYTGFPDPLVFNGMGIMEGVPSGAAVCVEPGGNPGAIDSIVINTTRLQIGKRTNGTDCQAGNITIK